MSSVVPVMSDTCIPYMEQIDDNNQTPASVQKLGYCNELNRTDLRSRRYEFPILMLIEWEREDMLFERGFSDNVVVGSVLVAFAAIGLIGAGQTANGSVAVTWLWLGVGLSLIYLLYRLVVTLEQLVEDL